MMTQRQHLAVLRALVKQGQRKLRLQQWHIASRYAEPGEVLSGSEGKVAADDAWALLVVDGLSLHAELVMNPLTPLGEYEKTVMHELLHLVLHNADIVLELVQPMLRGLLEHHHHVAINVLAQALTYTNPATHSTTTLEAPPWTTPSPK
jgi:hypothetical protein